MITRAQITPGFKFKLNDVNTNIENKVFKIGGTEIPSYISEVELFGKQMNIEQIGTKKIKLYTFDMLGNMIKGEIRYEDMEEVVEQQFGYSNQRSYI